jgi:hypothetical protein
MAKQSTKKKKDVRESYRFKDGEKCTVYGAGNVIDNSNLTDEMAIHLLAKGYIKENQLIN